MNPNIQPANPRQIRLPRIHHWIDPSPPIHLLHPVTSLRGGFEPARRGPEAAAEREAGGSSGGVAACGPAAPPSVPPQIDSAQGQRERGARDLRRSCSATFAGATARPHKDQRRVAGAELRDLAGISGGRPGRSGDITYVARSIFLRLGRWQFNPPRGEQRRRMPPCEATTGGCTMIFRLGTKELLNIALEFENY